MSDLFIMRITINSVWLKFWYVINIVKGYSKCLSIYLIFYYRYKNVS